MLEFPTRERERNWEILCSKYFISIARPPSPFAWNIYSLMMLEAITLCFADGNWFMRFGKWGKSSGEIFASQVELLIESSRCVNWSQAEVNQLHQTVAWLASGNSQKTVFLLNTKAFFPHMSERAQCDRKKVTRNDFSSCVCVCVNISLSVCVCE